MYFLHAEKKAKAKTAVQATLGQSRGLVQKKHQYVSFEVENNSLSRSVEFVLADVLAGLLKQHNI